MIGMRCRAASDGHWTSRVSTRAQSGAVSQARDGQRHSACRARLLAFGSRRLPRLSALTAAIAALRARSLARNAGLRSRPVGRDGSRRPSVGAAALLTGPPHVGCAQRRKSLSYDHERMTGRRILAGTSRRRESRHRVFRRPRYERRASLDAPEGRDPVRLHREPRAAGRAGLRRDPAQGARSTAPRRRG